MNFLLVIFLWSSPIWGIYILGRLRIARLHRLRRHDQIITALSGIRDDMALKAIRGEIPLNGEIFRFFYETLSTRISQEKQLGLCFYKLIRSTLRRQPSEGATQKAKMLLRQIRQSDDEVKEMVLRLVEAHEVMLLDARWTVRLYKLTLALHATHASFSRWISHQRYLPEQTRQFAKLTGAMRKAASSRSDRQFACTAG